MREILKRFEDNAKSLKLQIGALYYLSQDRRVGIVPKLLIGVAMLYALNPLDLIPDFIPLVGHLDDLLLIPALIALAIRLVPKEHWEQALKLAQSQPVRLHKNWAMGLATLALWLTALIWLTRTIAGMLA